MPRNPVTPRAQPSPSLVRLTHRGAGGSQSRLGASSRPLLRVGTRQLAALTRQLATMQQAGLPLLQALQTLSRQTPDRPTQSLLERIRQDIGHGMALSTALRQHPACFDALYCQLVEAGECAGLLEATLLRLAHDLERGEALRRKVKAALLYPLVLLGVTLAVLALLLTHVIPAFVDVFAGFGAELPGPTRWVLQASANVQAHGWWPVSIAGLLLLTRHWWSRQTGAQKLASWLRWHTPLWGRLQRQAILARWLHTLSALLGAGVPMVQALGVASPTIHDFFYRHATAQVQAEVAQGTALSQALQNTGRFPPLVLQMCLTGENAGSLDVLLQQTAHLYEQEVDTLVGALSGLLEPLLMVGLGSVIGGIVLALYLPIFQLGQAL